MLKTIRRFQKKYIIDSDTNCYIWQGAKRGKYGLFRFNSKIESAHRVSYILNFENIPDNMVVLHKCDNPLCVNPLHLEIGTYQDNYNIRKLKGRFKSKLTGDQVRYIFNSVIDNKTLSEKYNVSIDTIRRIKKGISWVSYLDHYS